MTELDSRPDPASWRGDEVRFTGDRGQQLVGRLHRPRGVARAHALFAHCFTCSKDIKAAVTISTALAEKGIGTLRFDFTGLGESEGDFADSTFSANVGDLVAAAAYLETSGQAPSLLIGHSLGGAAALAAAGRIESVTAVATIGAPFEPNHVRRLIEGAAPGIEAELATGDDATVVLAGRSFRIRGDFLADLERHCNASAIRKLGRALLIFHAPEDSVVDIEQARRIYEAARHPKSFVSLSGADHMLRRSADARYVADVLSAWASRYVTAESEPAATPPDSPDHEREVLVRGTDGAFLQTIRVGGHLLTADEPRSVGGDDAGPTPYELLLAGLGACTSMTMHMYARRKAWPLREVEVALSHARVHAKDCADCDSGEGMVSAISRTIAMTGDLSDDQRSRLMEIADRCPVHRTLEGEIKIRTRQKGAAD